ncbi:class I SAM-dependent methyltransferase [Janibacter sp. G56]|uniref:class I SAM-dependent methyltransferase n=1 Tax=Janibacter sp. G56 TaxID=3418717 RepID=UPI003CFFB2B9
MQQSPRLPGSALAADAAHLPFADGALDCVTMVWLLHLVPDAEPMVAEAARVLRPAGLLVTTVDKAAANGAMDRSATDERGLVTALAGDHGLDPAGETTFVGVGQRGEPTYTLMAYRKRTA